MITAQQARELAGPTAKDYLKFIDEKIRQAATDKKHEVFIRENPYASWLYKESDLSDEPRKAVQELRKLGFTVSLYYQENQFVDIALWIQW